jgi:hypothetical protein
MNYQVSPTTDLGAVTLNESGYVRSILQNIQLIMKTRQGSVPMYREFGLPMRFIDKPISIAQQICYVEVREAIGAFEPRAEVVDVSFDESDISAGILIPVVEVRIL